MPTIHAVISDDPSGRYTKAHLTHAEALADGGRYARERFAAVTGKPMHGDVLTDEDAIDDLRSLDGVSIEVETINVPAAVVRELFALLEADETR